MIALTCGAYAGETSMEEARNEASLKLKRAFSDEMNQYQNYFYERDISTMKEKVELIVLVNDKNQLEFVRANCRNCDATEFVRYVLAENKIRVDEQLAGKVLRVNLELRYKAW